MAFSNPEPPLHLGIPLGFSFSSWLRVWKLLTNKGFKFANFNFFLCHILCTTPPILPHLSDISPSSIPFMSLCHCKLPVPCVYFFANSYCTISINSAGHVVHYMPAEILILAHGRNDHYTDFFLADTSKQRVR